MSIELAKAYVQIIPTTQNFGSQLSGAISGDSEEAGKTAGTSVVGGIGKAIAGGAAD